MNNQSKEFNITTLTRIEYEKNKNTDGLKDILSRVDYSEISKKDYILYWQEPGDKHPKQHFRTEEETLAQNFMDCLPFEAYQPYVDKKWLNIQFRDDYPLIRTSLYSGNFKMLSLLGDLGFEACLSNEKDNDMYFYKRTYLNKILNINEVVNNGRDKTKDFYDGYYEIFKKGLVQYKATMEDAHKKMNYQQDIVIESWLFSMDTFSDKYSNNNVEQIKVFLSSLASKPQAEKITDDVMGQIKKANDGTIVVIINGKKKKQKIDVLNIIENSDIIESAIWENNFNFINKLKNALNIPDSLIEEKIVSCLDKAINESVKEVYHNETYLHRFKSNRIGEFILSQNENNIKNIHHLGLLALSEKEPILNYVRQNIDLNNSFLKIKDSVITYNDTIAISHILNAYIEENLSTKNIKKKPLFLEVGERLSQLGYKPQIDNWSSLAENIKENVLPFFQDFYYKDKNTRLDLPKGVNEWLNQFYLNLDFKGNSF
jgi:hypothetical protein